MGGLNPVIMRVFLFERGEIEQVSKLNPKYRPIFQVSAESLIESINESDIVIAPIINSNSFLLPSPLNQSIVDFSPIWSEILNNEFVISNQYVNPDNFNGELEIAIYIRNTQQKD